MHKYIIALVLAISSLVAANVRADIIRVFTADERQTYRDLAGASTWAFAGMGQMYNEQAPWEFGFSLMNLVTGELVAGGNVKLDNWNGNGNGYVNENLTVVSGMGFTLGHNSANYGVISFGPEITLSSLFIDQHTHSKGFEQLDITVFGTDGSSETVNVFKKATDGSTSCWFGFILGEGVYVDRIEFKIIGTNNTGFGNMNIGFGDGTPFDPSPVPAPATLLVLGLGLAGLGFARARNNRKKA